MPILLFFAFVSGLVTIAAPCIWPLLPIILSSSATGGYRKPLGVTLGIITSFAFFTLTLSYIVKIIPIDLDLLRLLAVAIIGFFGLTLIIPQLNQAVEGWVSRLSGSVAGKASRNVQGAGFISGFITGAALGIVWTPCAGPILATIATLAATQAVNVSIILVTMAYVLGVGVPLFIFALLGQHVFTRSRSLSKYTGRIQQVFGIIMILTALLILTGYDRVLQSKLLDTFPSYSSFLTKLESNNTVKQQLDSLRQGENNPSDVQPGKPINTLDMPTSNYPLAPDFVGINNWLNTENNKPLTMQELRGKVVLIDFWTYTCINCIRTLPYVTGWYEKYKDQGFVVVGVHTPEFEFEKKTENVENAIQQYNIHYPVAQDNDYSTWRAYDNHYWPAHYLIDVDGHVRETHFGEGNYAETEQKIQELLKEAGKKTDTQTLNVPDQGPKGFRLTPETYLGSNRAEPNDYVKLSDDWKIMPEYIQSSPGSTITLDFTAQNVFLVITPPNGGGTVDVTLDGKKVNTITLDTARLYDIVKLDKPGSHTVKLIFNNADTQAFAFTFG